LKLCAICGKVISEHAPTFKISLGFGDFDSIDSIVLHRECIEDKNPIDVLIQNFERF
tara:strand:- start:684 stop:854 length:171 start_codon:yes stop_codon:yes gene_type:complete